MSIAFTCTSCGKSFRVGEEFAGKPGKCTNCGAVMQIPPLARPGAGPVPAAIPVAAPNGPSPQSSRARVRARQALASLKEFKLKDFKRIKEIKRIKIDKKNRTHVGILAGITAGFLLLLVAMFWLFTRSSSPLGEELRYLPDNTQAITFVKMDQLLASEAYTELARDLPGFENEWGKRFDGTFLGRDKIDLLIVGGSLTTPDAWVAIIKTTEAVIAEDVKKDRSDRLYVETRVGRHTMLKGRDDSFAVVDSKTVVTGPTETVNRILARDEMVELSENLELAVKEANYSRGLSAAVDLAAVQAKRGPDGVISDPLGVLGKLDLFGFVDVGPDLEWLAVQASFQRAVSVNLTVTCKDAEPATDLRKLLDGRLMLFKRHKDMPKESGQSINSIKVYTRGAQVIGTFQFEIAELVPAYKRYYIGSPATPAP